MKPPPEEKLLRLIRGKGAAPSSGIAPAMPAISGSAAGMVTPDFRSRTSELPWLKAAVGVLGALLSLEIVCLILQTMWPLPAASVPRIAASSSSATAEQPSPTAVPTPEMPSVAASASRPLFSPVAPATPSAASPGSLPSGSANVLAARLTLMGIVSGNPAQAIIEDSQTQKTYFVTVGQQVVEGATVEQVLDNRVILNLAGEKIELSL